MSDSLKIKTTKGVFWSFLEQILARGVNFIIGIILARLLSPTEYGLLGMLGIFLALSQLFIDGGLAGALIRTKSPSDEDFSTVYLINLTLSAVFYLILFFIAPYIATFYEQPLLKPLLRTISLTLIIGSLSSVQGILLSIRVDFKAKTIISIASSITSGILGIACAYKGLGVWALVAQSLCATVVSTVITLAIVRWMPKLLFSKESFKKLFSYSSKMLVASAISVVYENAYPFVIGKRFSPADLGQYSRAGQFPGIANGIITGAINRVAFPVLSQIQDDNDRLICVYEKYIQLTCFLVFPVLMIMCGCAKPLVAFLLKDKWLDCVPLMQIICFTLLTNGLTTINLNLLYVKGRSDLVLRLEIIKKAIAFAVLLISMFFSIKAMCFGQLLYSFIATYLNTYYTKRILGYTFWQQVKSVAPYFLVSLVPLVESLLSSKLICNHPAALVVTAIICPTTYVVIAKSLNLYAYREAIDFFRSKAHLLFHKKM